MKDVRIVLMIMCSVIAMLIISSAGCEESKKKSEDKGEPTELEGTWNTVGQAGSACVMDTPVFTTDDIFAKKTVTFEGETFKLVDTRYNGCDFPGDVFYYYTYTGKIALNGSDLATGSQSITLTLEKVTITMVEGYDYFAAQFVIGNYWNYAESEWAKNKEMDITGRVPLSSMPEYTAPAADDVMPGIYTLNGTSLVFNFDKTPYDGYTAPSGGEEYVKAASHR